MVGKLRAAMDAKQAHDPDFVIMALCDLGGVPGASFAEILNAAGLHSRSAGRCHLPMARAAGKKFKRRSASVPDPSSRRSGPAAGLYFKRERCTIVEHAPTDLDVVRYWDLAATEKTELNDPD